MELDSTLLTTALKETRAFLMGEAKLELTLTAKVYKQQPTNRAAGISIEKLLQEHGSLMPITRWLTIMRRYPPAFLTKEVASACWEEVSGYAEVVTAIPTITYIPFTVMRTDLNYRDFKSQMILGYSRNVRIAAGEERDQFYGRLASSEELSTVIALHPWMVVHLMIYPLLQQMLIELAHVLEHQTHQAQ